MVYFQVI